METIKADSAKLKEEFAKIDETMQDVSRTSAEYTALAVAATRAYFSLESLGAISFLYQYSLDFFFEIFRVSISDDRIEKIHGKDYAKRRNYIEDLFFRTLYTYICPGMMVGDRLALGLRLAQVRADMDAAEVDRRAVDLLMKGGLVGPNLPSEAERARRKVADLGYLSNAQTKAMEPLFLLPAFYDLPEHMAQNDKKWQSYLSAGDVNAKMPDGWIGRTASGAAVTPLMEKLYKCLVVKALAVDRLPALLSDFTAEVMGEEFLFIPPFDLAAQMGLQEKGGLNRPMMMVLQPGFDPSSQITTLAAERKKKVVSMAMGSREGFDLADKMIANGAKQGQWVILKNVHLAVEWLKNLEKRIAQIALTGHADYRLFLCMEFNPKLPANLMRQSRVYVFEPPAGMKASLLRSYAGPLQSAGCDSPPVERCRLHFNLAVLHAIVLERVRYAPIGWTKRYEFSDADFRCGLTIVDTWIERACGTSSGPNPSNLDPSKIPWAALQHIMVQVVYGGRIDNDFDKELLRTFVCQLFCEDVYKRGSLLNRDPKVPLAGPESARKMMDCEKWVNALDAKGSPAWLGLSAQAEKMLRSLAGRSTLTSWLNLQSVEDASFSTTGSGTESEKFRVGGTSTSAPGGGSKDQQSGGGGGKKKQAAHHGNWLPELSGKLDTIMQTLPEQMQVEAAGSSSDNPMWRCFHREVVVASTLLERIREDLTALKEVCAGNARMTNDLRAIALQLNMDLPPPYWLNAYPVMQTLSSLEWVFDFKQRVLQLVQIMQTSRLSAMSLWAGGLMFPEAFLTATRQLVAQKNKWSLEELVPVLELQPPGTETARDGWLLRGCTLEGAKVNVEARRLEICDELSCEMPPILLRWVQRGSPGSDQSGPGYWCVPVYLNSTRTQLVTSSFQLAGQGDEADWRQRGTAIILWTK
eukprot:g18611.t1